MTGWWHTRFPWLFESKIDWSRDWNYESLKEPRTESEYVQREVLDNLLPWHPYTIYDQKRKLTRYMDFYGYDWDDVLYPSEHQLGYGSGTSGSIQWVSSNIRKLYKNK